MVTKFRDGTGGNLQYTLTRFYTTKWTMHLKTKTYKTHGEKYTLPKLIIHVREHYPWIIVDSIGFIPLRILI